MTQYDPKAAFEAEGDEDAREQSRAISMLGGGGASGDLGAADPALDAGGGEGRNVLGQTSLLIVAVAVIAAGSLYAMRVTQHADASSGEHSELEADLDNWITKLSSPDKVDPADPMHPSNLKALFSDTDDVLRVLSLNSTEHQVPIEYVKKNPFAFTLEEPTVTDAAHDPAAYERDLARRRQKMQADLDKHRLDSIMLGKRNVAMIDGEMYQAGDKLGAFEIVNIQDMQVTVRQGAEVFTLGLTDGRGR